MKLLTVIKLIHTIIWLIMVLAILYIFYSGVVGVFNLYTQISLILIFTEITALLLCNWTCPLTILARKRYLTLKDGDDIFLPTLTAKYNREIFGTLLAIGIVLMISKAALGILH